MLSEPNVETDHNKVEITVHSGIHSSHLLPPLSRGSSGNGNSSRHSLSVPSGVKNIQETTTAEASTPSPTKVPFCRLAQLNKPEIPVLLLGTIGAVVNGVQLPILGVLLSSVIKSFFEPADELVKGTRFWALMYLALAIACFVAHPLKSYSFAVAGCKLIRRIRSMCFEKVVYMEVSWFDEPDHSSGAIGARLSTDSASVKSMVGDALGLLVQNVATIIAGLVIAFEANWQMALIVIVLLPLVGVNGYVQMKFNKGFSADSKVWICGFFIFIIFIFLSSSLGEC